MLVHEDPVTDLRIKNINLESKNHNLTVELNELVQENAKLKEKVEYLESDAPRWKTCSEQTFISVDDFFKLRRVLTDKIAYLEKMLNGK